MKIAQLHEARLAQPKYIDWILKTSRTLNDDVGWKYINFTDDEFDDVIDQLKNAFGEPLPSAKIKGDWDRESFHWEGIIIDDREYRVAAFHDGLGKHELVVELD